MEIFTLFRSGFLCSGIAIMSALAAHPAGASQDTCEIPQAWITDGVPDPSILAANSEFDSFCAFHIWAWNAFLWSMEETDHGLRFETFPSQAQTIDGSAGNGNTAERPQLKLRTAKTDHPIDSIAQAGTQGLLVAQNKRAIYYSQYVNPQMYNQIQKSDWNNAAGLAKASPDARFDIGNIEYKAAWAVVDDTFTVPGAYTREASIPLLDVRKVDGVPTIAVPANPTYVTAEVALIGLHVVGWVKDHSEAIWASFSPAGIAPVVPQDGSVGPSDPVSTTGTPFYAANTPLADCNQTQVPVQTLDVASQRFGLATQACQIYGEGTLPGGNKDNVAAIQQLNASAAQSLPSSSSAKGYEEIGAVWSQSDSKMPDKRNTTFQDALVGSTVLSNPVVETFTQTDKAQDNCFACHNSVQYQPIDPAIPPLQASLLNLSHFLLQIYVKTFEPAN